MESKQKICKLPGCEQIVVPARTGPKKEYCSTRCANRFASRRHAAKVRRAMRMLNRSEGNRKP